MPWPRFIPAVPRLQGLLVPARGHEPEKLHPWERLRPRGVNTHVFSCHVLNEHGELASINGRPLVLNLQKSRHRYIAQRSYKRSLWRRWLGGDLRVDMEIGKRRGERLAGATISVSALTFCAGVAGWWLNRMMQLFPEFQSEGVLANYLILSFLVLFGMLLMAIPYYRALSIVCRGRIYGRTRADSQALRIEGHPQGQWLWRDLTHVERQGVLVNELHFADGSHLRLPAGSVELSQLVDCAERYHLPELYRRRRNAQLHQMHRLFRIVLIGGFLGAGMLAIGEGPVSASTLWFAIAMIAFGGWLRLMDYCSSHRLRKLRLRWQRLRGLRALPA